MAQTELRLDGLGIRKIVEIPPGIQVLSVSGNRLRNVGSISECLTLQEVNLAANKLSEAALAPLAALPALRVLNVSRNQVRSLTPFAPALAGHAFPALEELNISANPLSDVTAAMSLQKLRILTATDLAATTLKCVHSSLEVIDLRSCRLQSISSLQALPYLSELMLDGNSLATCKDLGVHSCLQVLRVAGNEIREISAVQLPSLTELDLASNKISQALNLAGAPRLVSLVARANQLTSLVQLSAMRSLTFLDASQNHIRALEPALCWSLRPLRVLLLNGNEIRDVEDVAQTMDMAGGLALEHFDLRDNPLSSAFYPFGERLPTWTWEAYGSLQDIEADSRDQPLDAVTLGVRERYYHRISLLCPTLQSLDGMLAMQLPSMPPSLSRKHASSRRGVDQDEVLYRTPRQRPSREEQACQASMELSMESPVRAVRESGNDAPKSLDDVSLGASLLVPEVSTIDAATSPVFRDGLLGQESAPSLVNLGLAPELLAVQRAKVSEEALAEVAAAAAAAALASAEQVCSGCHSILTHPFCSHCGARRDDKGNPGGPDASISRSTWLNRTSVSQAEEAATSSQGSFLPVVNLRACDDRQAGQEFGVLPAASDSPKRQVATLDNLPSEAGRAHEMPPNPQSAVGQMEGRPADQLGLAPGAFDGSLPHDVIRLEDVLRDELMQKGEDFEVQQLHIVEKLEKAHEELAKQWQELDMERTRSNEQQEELTQRLAREQTELQEQLEVEVQKRHQWEKQQQWFLEKQQQDLEDHWQQEQNRRKRQWEAEQEEEFIKLQRRFQELQQQFQERLESAVPPRPPSPSRGFGLPEDDSLALAAPSLADVTAKLSARAQNQPTSPAIEQDPWQPEQTHTFRSLAQTILHPSTAWGSVTASRDVGQLDFVPGERIQLAIPAAWEETRVVPKSEPRAEPRSVPQAGPRAEARSAPQAEPKAEPRFVPQAEARASPQAEARASPRLPQAEPRAEPRSVPQAEPRASPQAEARGSPRSLPQAEPRASPRSVPQAEPRASPQAEARESPRSLPQAEPRAEPRSVPQAEPRASPQAEPRGSPRSLPHAEPVASPRSVPQAEARASPRLPQAEPRAEPRSVPQAEPRASPQAEARGSPRSLPQAEPRASPRSVPKAEPEPRSVPQAEASLPPAASPRSVPEAEARASSSSLPQAEARASPRFVPQAEPRAELRSVPQAEPRASPQAEARESPRSLPQAEPRAEPRSVPQAEPRGSPRSLPQAEPAASPRSVPQAEARASPRSLPQAEPSAEPRSVPQAEPRAEPRSAPQAEPKVESRFVPQAEPRAEPRFVPQAEPRAEPRSVPQAGPMASPRSVPQAGPRAEPRSVPQAEPRAEPRVVPPRTVPQPDRQKEPRSGAQAERKTVLPAEPVAQAELRAEPRFGTQAKPRLQPSSLHRLTQILGETDPATDSLWSDDKVEPGSDGAFQRALQGCGIWSDEQHKDDQHGASLTITASLQADHQRVVSQVPFGEGVAEPSQLATSRMRHDGEMNGSAASRASYLKFLQREIAAQRTFVRNIKEARKAPVKNITRDFSVAQRLQTQDLTGTGETGISGRSRSVEVLPRGADTRRPLRPRTPQVVQTQEVQPTVKQRSTSCSGKFSKVSSDDRSWHCIVSPVNAGVRGALEVLVSQQAWAIPGRPYIYSLCRAIQNCSLPARQHFDSLVMRDAAREGVLSPAGFSQRAFFCDENSKLSEVISSPFGFAAYKGKALLVALQLRHAERFCSPDSASLTGRTIIAEIALGRCHTTHRPLQELGLEKGLGAVPLAGLDSAYRRGADSVYFPKSGVLAVLSPSRALPIFLAEYSRQLVGAPVTSQMRVTTAG